MSSGGISELLELSRHLKQERLFVSAEKEQLHALHTTIGAKSQRLYHLTWIARQQKNELDRLILADRNTTPAACCQRVNTFEMVTFMDGYRQLTYHESKIGRFLKLFREIPKLVATCLMHAEKQSIETMQNIAGIMMSGLYGNVVLPEDEAYVVQILKHLIDLQVSQSDDPRRLLRKGSCTFSTIFKLLNEGHFSARLFLTAALHKPVMQLLMEDEWFYDIDPDRALHRFPPHERLRRFGQPGSDDYEQKIQRYRDVTTDKLVALVNHFVINLQANMYCFPPSLAWIISQLYHTLVKAETVDRVEARAICADLVLTFFICPAVCDPEPYGITTDAPISYIARHNLIQVGQILQVLAISKPEEIDNKTRDLYSKFPPGFMSFLLDALLDAPLVSAPAPSQSNLSGFSRSAALLSCSELLELIGFLHNVAIGLKEDSAEKKQLEDLLSTCNLPPQSVIQALCSSSSHSAHNSPNSTPQATPPGTPVSSKKLSKVKDKKKLFLSPPGTNDSEEVDSIQFAEDVLVISFGVANDCPGLLSEQKVLEQEVRQKKVKYNSLLPGEDDPVSESEVLVHEKRTRFSLSHDQDSIATSDNLEAISEAASSHSVTSDLDNENDNLSDMMSANVSGRGTPNVSGRDTPISQADSQMEGPEERQPMVPDLPVIVQKTNREDVTDRFGKFEIKHEIERDETKSTVSDTWSTDVLASDSEPPEQNQLERLEEVAEEPASNVLGVQEVVMEISETASDAWSTDVLASDTSERQADRLLELDQDDVASVSSRGVGPGSEIGELPGEATGDNTPQASGNQSPHESPFESGDTDSGTRSPKAAPRLTKDAVASANNQLSQASSNRHSYNPTSSSSEQSIFRMNRYISDEGDRQVSAVRVTEFLATGRRGKPIHSPVPLKLVPDGNLAAPQERSRSEDFDREGEANAVFSSDDLNLNDAEGSDKDHRSPISKASSDACLNCLDSGTSALDLSFHSSSSVGSLVDFSDRGHGDSGVNSTTTMGSSVSVDTLTNEFSDGLKLTEHQNEKLDERRLSSVSSCYFDPLMQDGVATRQTVSTGDLPQCKGVSYAEQGARPKTSSGCYPAPPKISVSQTGTGVQPSKGKGVLGVPNGKVQTPAPKGARGESDHMSDVGVVSSDGVGSKTADSASGAFGAPVAAPRAAVKPLSVSLAMQASSEMPPCASANKEDDDKKQDKHDKRKPGFFNAFRERLTRGSFPVPVQVPRGTKRKVSTKSADEVFRPTVVIDSERGIDAPVKALTSSTTETTTDETTAKLRSSGTTGSKMEDLATVTDTSDEILAKYRSKPAPVPKPSDSSTTSSLPSSAGGTSRPVEEEEGPPAYDPNNLETCKAFLDAKKKLRLVLSNADFQGSFHGYQYGGSVARNLLVEPKENELVAFLKLQLAEAINLQDKDLIAQLHETIRCLRQFDSQETKKLLKTMREEYRCRSPYVAYLVRCRQGLLSSLALIERLLVRVERNKAVMNKYLLSVFVRLFLEKKEKALMKFISEFQKLTVSDEKTDLVENFLGYLHREMEEDSLWQVASASQLDEAKLYVERNVMSHIYTHAMFPNGDGDILRDQILSEHIKKLSKVITPMHKDLRIPKVYHYECPWPAAQTEIYMINAYKTPKDKLQCILRCSSTIMNLLSMANEKSVPAADDFMPVLIYILIKANIPSLLSTVQYIKSFYEKRLSGEEQYWWMQFSSAIEFIKTMDYNE